MGRPVAGPIHTIHHTCTGTMRVQRDSFYSRTNEVNKRKKKEQGEKATKTNSRGKNDRVGTLQFFNALR